MENHNPGNPGIRACLRARHRQAYGLILAILLSGCIVRTYSVVKDRVDQEVTGNQGYLTGSGPAGAQAAKKITQRTSKVVEIELRSPVKFERLKEPSEPAQQQGRQDISREGNRGYLKGQPPTLEPMPTELTAQAAPASKFDIYLVQKGDTLQKISSKPEIYGTTKKWMKLYEANRDKLASPDKIKPGQELKIPRD